MTDKGMTLDISEDFEELGQKLERNESPNAFFKHRFYRRNENYERKQCAYVKPIYFA